MTTNKQLRELAEKAGVQEWGQDKGDVVALGGCPGSSGPLVLASANENFPEHALNTASFIATANPVTVLALLDEVETLQAECEKLRKLASECADYLSHNEHTCINHGSVLHSKLIDAAMEGGKP